jgi:hypothetical protein
MKSLYLFMKALCLILFPVLLFPQDEASSLFKDKEKYFFRVSLEGRSSSGLGYYSHVYKDGFATYGYDGYELDLPPYGYTTGTGHTDIVEYWTLAQEVFQSNVIDQLDSISAKQVVEELPKQNSKFNGKAFITIVHGNGSYKIYQRDYEGKFKDDRLQKLNDLLMIPINPKLVKDKKRAED